MQILVSLSATLSKAFLRNRPLLPIHPSIDGKENGPPAHAGEPDPIA